MSRPAVEGDLRVTVVVTFLRMERPPSDPAPPLPPGYAVRREAPCSVERYRSLYNAVGEQYLWWLRRTVPDRQLAGVLRDPRVSIDVLEDAQGRAVGFYELDRNPWPAVNLSYFGLMPHAVGHGMGYAFLRHAVDQVWAAGAVAMTVNTCTADHPRALPTYRRAGFVPVREVREDWDVPARLGMTVPARLRG